MREVTRRKRGAFLAFLAGAVLGGDGGARRWLRQRERFSVRYDQGVLGESVFRKSVGVRRDFGVGHAVVTVVTGTGRKCLLAAVAADDHGEHRMGLVRLGESIEHVV